MNGIHPVPDLPTFLPSAASLTITHSQLHQSDYSHVTLGDSDGTCLTLPIVTHFKLLKNAPLDNNSPTRLEPGHYRVITRFQFPVKTDLLSQI